MYLINNAFTLDRKYTCILFKCMGQKLTPSLKNKKYKEKKKPMKHKSIHKDIFCFLQKKLSKFTSA